MYKILKTAWNTLATAEYYCSEHLSNHLAIVVDQTDQSFQISAISGLSLFSLQ